MGSRPEGVLKNHLHPDNLRTLYLFAAVVLCVLPKVAGAQTAVHFDAGGASVQYNDSLKVTSGTLSAAASALSANTSFAAMLAASTTRQSALAMFGALEGSVFSPRRGSLRGELHGSGSLTTYDAGQGSGHALAGARAHIARVTAGAWIGASAGAVKDPIGWRSSHAGELGAWKQMDRAIAQAVVMPVKIAGGLSFTDVEGTVRFVGSRLEATGTAGLRTRVRGFDESAASWVSVNAIAWALRDVGITAGIGSYPTDPGQNLPSAKYATLGVRFSPGGMRHPAAGLSADVLSAPERATSPAMAVRRGREERATMVFHAPSARQVEIMGDFTDWTPVQMGRSASGGAWTISLPVTSGVHQVNVRVDGGGWIVPAGLATVRDEFGGSVGVLLVP